VGLAPLDATLLRLPILKLPAQTKIPAIDARIFIPQ